eukprot:1024422-Pleurochrysis_carterae.AAC.1
MLARWVLRQRVHRRALCGVRRRVLQVRPAVSRVQLAAHQQRPRNGAAGTWRDGTVLFGYVHAGGAERRRADDGGVLAHHVCADARPLLAAVDAVAVGVGRLLLGALHLQLQPAARGCAGRAHDLADDEDWSRSKGRKGVEGMAGMREG